MNTYRPTLTRRDWALSPDFHYVIIGEPPVDDGERLIRSKIIERSIRGYHRLWRISIAERSNGDKFPIVENGSDRRGNLTRAFCRFREIDDYDRLPATVDRVCREMYNDVYQSALFPE